MRCSRFSQFSVLEFQVVVAELAGSPSHKYCKGGTYGFAGTCSAPTRPFQWLKLCRYVMTYLSGTPDSWGPSRGGLANQNEQHWTWGGVGRQVLVTCSQKQKGEICLRGIICSNSNPRKTWLSLFMVRNANTVYVHIEVILIIKMILFSNPVIPSLSEFSVLWFTSMSLKFPKNTA